ncbi:MAG: hypothetical protein IJU25_02255 [Lachnospiraceae bacterium]|nr:hypothetical protein [Lachnospiraceae bacterium]
MNGKIIFIFSTWPSKRGAANKGITYLKERGYRVEIWLMQVQHTYTNLSASDPLIDKEEMRIFHSYGKYERYVKKAVKDSIFVVNHTLSPASVYPICANGGRYIVEGGRAQGPRNRVLKQYPKVEKKQRRERFFARIAESGLKAFFLRQTDQIALRIAGRYERAHTDYLTQECPPLAVFDTNDYIREKMFLTRPDLKNCTYFYIPSVEYNDYLIRERVGEEITEECILFAGGALGFPLRGAKEAFLINEKLLSPEPNKQYRRELERFFDRMEEHYGLPVVVAAHPGVNYGDYDFGGRRIVYGKTCELAKKCKVYILIFSRSVAYPLLWDKEIMVYYNDALTDGIVWDNFGVPLAEELGLTPLNISDEEQMREPWKFASKIRSDLRESFLNRYVKNADVEDSRLYGEILDEWFQKETVNIAF